MDITFLKTMALACCATCGQQTLETHYHDFVYVDEADEEYLCPISKLPFFDPVEGKCEHPVSQIEMKKWLETKQECPVCREPLSHSSLKTTHRLIRNKVDSLKIVCPHCQTQVVRSALAAHLNECIFAPVFCPSAKRDENFETTDSETTDSEEGSAREAKVCREILCRKDVEAHLALCPFARVPCTVEGCRRVGQRRFLQNHIAKCGHVKVTCQREKCSMTFRRKDTKAHERVCPEKKIVCTFSFGEETCGFTCLTSAMESHQATCPLRGVSCGRCGEKFLARDVQTHDCVAFLLKRLERAEADSKKEEQLQLCQKELQATKNVLYFSAQPEYLGIHRNQVFHVAFSPDGTMLCSLSIYSELKITLLATRRTIDVSDPARHSARGDPASAYCVTFSPDNKKIFVGENNRISIYHFDGEKWRFFHQIEVRKIVHGLGFSPDGRYLYAGDSLGSVFDTGMSWQLVHQIRARRLPYEILNFACSPDGQYVFFAVPYMVEVYSGASWNKTFLVELLTSAYPLRLSVSPNNKYIVAALHEEIVAFKIGTWEMVFSFAEAGVQISGVSFLPSSTHLVITTCKTSSLLIMEFDSRRICRVLDGLRDGYGYNAVVSSDGKQISSGMTLTGGLGGVCIWNPKY